MPKNQNKCEEIIPVVVDETSAVVELKTAALVVDSTAGGTSDMISGHDDPDDPGGGILEQKGCVQHHKEGENLDDQLHSCNVQPPVSVEVVEESANLENLSGDQGEKEWGPEGIKSDCSEMWETVSKKRSRRSGSLCSSDESNIKEGDQVGIVEGKEELKKQKLAENIADAEGGIYPSNHMQNSQGSSGRSNDVILEKSNLVSEHQFQDVDDL